MTTACTHPVRDDRGRMTGFQARALKPDAIEYTWWSNRGQAYAKNVGWRIDYHVTTPGLAALARRAQVYKDTRFSDHAPLILDYAD